MLPGPSDDTAPFVAVMTSLAAFVMPRTEKVEADAVRKHANDTHTYQLSLQCRHHLAEMEYRRRTFGF